MICTRCGKDIKAKNALFKDPETYTCSRCTARKKEEAEKQEELELPQPEPYPWKHMSDQEVLAHLGSFMRRHVELSVPEPVIVYTPGSQDFKRLEQLYARH